MLLLTVLTKTERSDPAIAWTLPAYLGDGSVRRKELERAWFKKGYRWGRENLA